MRKYRILIVDDESRERNGIEKLIRRYQYELDIYQAQDGREALEIMKNTQIDILLTDIKMPVMTGMELIGQVHKNGWNPVCIIYSAYGEFEYAQNAIALGVMQYLLKPIKLGEFQALFNKVVAICDAREKQKAENEILKKTLKSVEDTKFYRHLLRYLEIETDDITEIEDKIFAGGEVVPIILSSYSSSFARYWENYENDLRELFRPETIVVNKDDTQTLLLVPRELLRTLRKTEEICEKLILISRQKYQSAVFIVVGGSCRSSGDLRAEYRRIQEQLDYQIFVSESTYFLDNQIGFVKNQSDMLSLYFKKVETCARLEDFNGMKREFEKAFTYIEKKSGFSSIYVKYTFSEGIKRCCEVLNKKECMMEVVEDIYGSNSIRQVKNAVFRLLNELEKTQGDREEEGRLVALARSFIHDNYQEYTLGVSMVADELHITAAYLSTLFKVETGCNIVKYISNYRIEKAKELLETTNIRVGDVAEKVGYLNTSYFIALFRNNTGYSPAKYRERILLNE